VARSRFEMFQFRQILVRLRQGDTDREIARSGLMGRRKAPPFDLCVSNEGGSSQPARCLRMPRSRPRSVRPSGPDPLFPAPSNIGS